MYRPPFITTQIVETGTQIVETGTPFITTQIVETETPNMETEKFSELFGLQIPMQPLECKNTEQHNNETRHGIVTQIFVPEIVIRQGTGDSNRKYLWGASPQCCSKQPRT